MNYGFIGAGNMASAITKGMVGGGFAAPTEIFIYDTNPAAMDKCAAGSGAVACDSLSQLAEKVQVIVLAVKPFVFPALLPELAPLVRQYRPLLVSIAAGQTIEAIENMLGFQTALIRIMPNINAEIGASVTALVGNDLAASQQKELVRQLFESVGAVTEIPENQFPIFSAIAGCSPAYLYLFIDSLAKGALKAGMNKKQAIQIAAQSVLGSAKMVLESQMHPLELMDKVCSPGGSTIEGVCALEACRFQQAVVSAVDASIQKDRAMNG